MYFYFAFLLPSSIWSKTFSVFVSLSIYKLIKTKQKKYQTEVFIYEFIIRGDRIFCFRSNTLAEERIHKYTHSQVMEKNLYNEFNLKSLKTEWKLYKNRSNEPTQWILWTRNEIASLIFGWLLSSSSSFSHFLANGANERHMNGEWVCFISNNLCEWFRFFDDFYCQTKNGCLLFN